MKATPDRRNFIKLALAGTLGSKFLFSSSTMAKESMMVKEAIEDVPKLKLSAQIKTPFLDEDLKFVKQLGIEYITTWVRTPESATFENYRALREVDADCFIIADHWPDMTGGPLTGFAFTIGYIKALLERANEEVGG